MDYIIALDLGGSKLSCGVVSSAGEQLYVERTELAGKPYDKQTLSALMSGEVERLLAAPEGKSACAVGVSMPGCCDCENGVFLLNVTTGLANWPIAAELGGRFSLPVYIENDANACAVGEKVFGNCKDCSDYVWITLSYGCGGALFLNGELYRGHSFMAGEIGHIPVEHRTPTRCGCGVWGDMEADGSGTAIGRKYLERSGRAPDAGFKSREVSALARSGDELAKAVFRESGEYLGALCAMTANLLNIEKAVVGGGVGVFDFDLLSDGIDASLKKLLFPVGNENFRVEKTALGYNASLLGAAATAIINHKKKE